MIDQCLIEMLSTDSALTPGLVGKIESNRVPRQIKELDPAQSRRRQALNPLADTQAIQDFPGAGVETIAANLFSWKMGSFENQGRETGACSQSGRSGSGRPGAYDQDVVPSHTKSSAMASATIRPFAVNRRCEFSSSR